MAEINNVIAEASQDLQTIEDFVNLPAGSNVRPRLLPSVNVGTLAGTRDAIFEAGGLPATPFATKALMTASALADGKYAMVTDDTVNNGLYVNTAGAWVKSAYDPLSQANVYTNKVRDEMNSQTGYYSTKNLFNPAQGTTSGFYNGGTAAPNSSYTAGLDYLPVIAGSKFWTNIAAGGAVIALYDASKAFLKSVDTNELVDGTYLVPSTISGRIPAYIRLSSLNSFFNTIQYGIGDKKPPVSLAYNEEYKIYASEEYKDNLFGKNILRDELGYYTTKNLFNPAQGTTSGFYKYGTAAPNSSYTAGLDYLPVVAGSKFWTSGVVGGEVMALYDSSKTFLIGLDSNDLVDGTYLVPSTISGRIPAYIRLSSLNSIFNTIEYGIGDIRPPVSLAYNEEYKALTNSNYSSLVINYIDEHVQTNGLNGKVWAALGDSITATNNNYAQVLANRHQALLVNYAVSGARLHRENDSTGEYIIAERYVDMPNTNPPDIITIAAGVNDRTADAVGSPNLGVMTDRTVNTWYGALHVLLSGLRTKFPFAKIGFISQIPDFGVRLIPFDENNGRWLKHKAVLQVCAYYSIPVWEGAREFGFVPTDNAILRDALMPDGLHPSVAGHIWYANRVEDFILRLAK